MYIPPNRRHATYANRSMQACVQNETMIPLINLKKIMINAVNKMEVGPPKALYRRSLQITLRCWLSNELVLSVKEKVSLKGSDKNRKDECK